MSSAGGRFCMIFGAKGAQKRAGPSIRPSGGDLSGAKARFLAKQGPDDDARAHRPGAESLTDRGGAVILFAFHTLARMEERSLSTAKKPSYKLVIVESPAKAHTIGKFLGRTYKVEASQGHVRDLPRSQLGVDVENHFEPKYITIRGRGEILERIRKEAKGAKSVILATDPDREGEAISWHLAGVLGIDPMSACRVEFNEITEKTVKAAVKSPRSIDMSLVDAQQARRVLDRLVGYKISPLFWAKIRKGLSAGRVQSVATRMIVEREQEIEAFIPEEYWTIDVDLGAGKGKISAKLHKIGGERVKLSSQAEAEAVGAQIAKGGFAVREVTKRERRKNPTPPFTTSSMQQEAGRKLGFTTARTMRVAQQLYEGIDVKGHGTLGLISYIRTDSVRLSEEAVAAAREAIVQRFGSAFVPENPIVYKGRSSAQDAHEAIRPTDIALTPDSIKESLTPEQLKLYRLVYNRFIACQMASAVYETLAVDIASDQVLLRALFTRTKFPGFTAVYEVSREEGEEPEETVAKLPEIEEGLALDVLEVSPQQHFTQPPPRYSEASLVRAMEELGIGRPSTYAPTISTILARGYVVSEKKQLYPSDLGVMTTDLMKEYFADIVDPAFTAGLEGQLDEVEASRRDWRSVVANFYAPFAQSLKVAEEQIEHVEIPDEVSDVVCEKCGAMMVYKMGRFGRFLACPNFPACHNTKNIQIELDVPCPQCGAKLLEKRSHKGRKFYGCERWPECDFVSWNMPVAEKCPHCGSYMTLSATRRGRFYVCANEQCRNRIEAPEEAEE